jgi:hypothetical protein
MTDPYPTIRLDEHRVDLALGKANELVEHFMPKIVKRGKTGSQIPDHTLEDRINRLYHDQVTGQISQLAITTYMTGTDQLYRIQRWNCMQTPDKGDEGYDLPGLRMDVKGTRIKSHKDPREYSLVIRPRERKPDWTYCLVLVELKKNCALCHIMGWATDDELDGKVATSGVFNGAHVLGYSLLHPLPKLIWDL